MDVPSTVSASTSTEVSVFSMATSASAGDSKGFVIGAKCYEKGLFKGGKKKKRWWQLTMV